jgi:L-serine dehydratase
MERMAKLWDAMKSASRNYEDSLHSASGLSGGDGALMREKIRKKNTLCGDFIGQVMVHALQMAESNACMKRIVAAPTAGSCGVLPAVLLSYQQQYGVSDEEVIKALFVAAGVGEVIARRAFISGAEGGCQAEIGSASSMAAAAVVFLHGGNSQQAAHASAIALKSLLGLTCDPVAGLVEVPCVKRNVMGAVNALTAADMALAGIKSAIPPDEVIDAMRQVGMCMSPSLRETGAGGLAETPTGIKIAEKIHRRPITKE